MSVLDRSGSPILLAAMLGLVVGVALHPAPSSSLGTLPLTIGSVNYVFYYHSVIVSLMLLMFILGAMVYADSVGTLVSADRRGDRPVFSIVHRTGHPLLVTSIFVLNVILTLHPASDTGLFTQLSLWLLTLSSFAMLFANPAMTLPSQQSGDRDY